MEGRRGEERGLRGKEKGEGGNVDELRRTKTVDFF